MLHYGSFLENLSNRNRRSFGLSPRSGAKFASRLCCNTSPSTNTLVEKSSCDTLDPECTCKSNDLWDEVVCCVIASCNDLDKKNSLLIAKNFCGGAGIDIHIDDSEAHCSAVSASNAGVGAKTTSSEQSPSATATDDGDISTEVARETGTKTGMETSIRSSSSSEPTQDSEESNQTNGSSGGGNSTALGLGIGLGVGIPLSLGVIGLLAFLIWKTKRQNRISAQGSNLTPGTGQGEAFLVDEKKPGGAFNNVPSPSPADGERHELGHNPAPIKQTQLGELA